MDPLHTPSPEEIAEKAGVTVKQFVLVALVLLFFLTLLLTASSNAARSGTLIVAIGFIGAGAAIGFLYSTYGEEERTFSPALSALTTALGGASLADITNSNGLLRHIYRELGVAAGLATNSYGIVIALATTFAPLGFFIMYFHRKLVVNRLVRSGDDAEARQREIERTALVPAGEIELDATSGEAVFRTDPAARAAATEWLKREPQAIPTFDDLMGDARAKIALEKHPEAISALEQALRFRPGNPSATLLLAAAHVASESYKAAVELLESLIRHDPGQAPLNAWKLLGYSRLFSDPSKPDFRANLWQSIAASSKFLNAVPDDLGALLNRACAYGQLGPEEPRAKAPMLADLRQLFQVAPEARENVRALLRPDLDFAAWAQDEDFKYLLAGA